jgi:hypothetical protein
LRWRARSKPTLLSVTGHRCREISYCV